MPRRGDPSGRAFPSLLMPTFRFSWLFIETIAETLCQSNLNILQRLKARKVLHLFSFRHAVPPVLTCHADGSSWPCAGG